MLKIQHLSKQIPNELGENSSLKDISLFFPQKGLVLMTGLHEESKYQLSSLLGGLTPPDSGDVFVEKKFKRFNFRRIIFL
ncbi:MAG: hypothetical protein U9532_03435 ['Conium maculatum' witches'-broom phytoplasma]|nr:hypothetical protein ['Conium maculatum' witches'-broom phytoplasma]